MNLLVDAEVRIDLPFLNILLSAVKWEVRHLIGKVKSCDIIHLG